jgi:alkanesulfonate monooxygenase SsuD/methylene tetrahydromethanopterin reductase-like flavin-dependent oxidoreductase (luciferase family)
VPRTAIAIKTVQQPLPPLYIASTQPPILKRFQALGAIPLIAASTLGSPVLYRMADGLQKNWREIGVDPATKPVSIMQYVHVADSREEVLEAAERGRYIGRMAHHLRLEELPLELEGGFIRDVPFEGEHTLSEYASNMVIGDPHRVAERMIADIRHIGPVHYACNFQFGGMPLSRAKRSLERFKDEVVPLIERELGPIGRIGSAVTSDAAE